MARFAQLNVTQTGYSTFITLFGQVNICNPQTGCSLGNFRLSQYMLDYDRALKLDTSERVELWLYCHTVLPTHSGLSELESD